MVTLTRRQALLFRTVLKNTLLDQEPRREWPQLALRGTPEGLTLQSQKGDLAVCWQIPGPPQEGALAFRSTVLCELEAKNDEPITLEERTPGRCQAHWQQGVAPRDWEFDTVTPDSVPPLPPLPKKLVAMPDHFARVLAEAAQVTARDSARFALSKVQLRGRAGEVVATDGKQLLVCRGFSFPFSDDILIPRLPIFERKGLLPAGPVEVGRADAELTLCLGPWQFLVRVDKQGRFPNIHSAIPDRRGVTCTLHLGPADVHTLLSALPELSAEDPDQFPITLDLGEKITVRAQSQDSDRAMVIALPESRIEGKPVVLSTNRQYLLRALHLGLHTLEICQPDQPLVCRNETKLYVWLPRPTPRAASQTDPLPTNNVAGDRPAALSVERSIPTMSTPPNGRSRQPTPEAHSEPENGTSLDPLAEAEELRRLLQDCSGRLSRLTAWLRQQRRQTRVFRQALSSLRQFDLDG